MAAANRAGAAHAGEDVRTQLKDDKQLYALHVLFTRADFIAAANSHRVVWGHVKGYPWWPVRARPLCCAHDVHAELCNVGGGHAGCQ